MEKIINTYEVLFAVSVKNGDEAAEATVAKIKNLIADNAEIVAEDTWGKRKLAYPINYENEGFYELIYFKSEPAFTSELTRVLGITEDALRYIVLSVDEKKQTINVGHKPADEVPAEDDDDDEAVEEAAEEVVEVAAEEAAEAPAEE